MYLTTSNQHERRKKMKKTALLAALALVAAMSVPALADQRGNNNGATPDLTVTSTDTTTTSELGHDYATDSTGVAQDSMNGNTLTNTDTDNSTYTKTYTSTDTDTKTYTNTENKAYTNNENKAYTSTDNKLEVEVKDNEFVNGNKSYEVTEDSYNTSNYTKAEDSYNSSTINLTVGDVSVMTSASELSAVISCNRIELSDEESAIETGSNFIKDSSFSNAAGITQAGQNSGINSLVQQSVSVNATKK
jgi:hypothetical protein